MQGGYNIRYNNLLTSGEQVLSHLVEMQHWTVRTPTISAVKHGGGRARL